MSVGGLTGSRGRLRRAGRGGVVRMSSSVRQTGVGFGDSLEKADVRLGHNTIKQTVGTDDTRSLETVGDAVDAWNDYLMEKEDQVLVLETTDPDTNEHLVLPHEHRWTDTYRNKTYARLKTAEEGVREKYGDPVPTTMLTLTAPHDDKHGNPRPFNAVLQDIKAGWDKARRVIRRETEGIDTEYLAVYEPHKTGYPHLHVVIFGVARESIGEKVRELWTERYVEGANKEAQDVTVRNGRDLQLESPAAYLMKYLSKSLAREETEDASTARELMPDIDGYEAFSALMWATGCRTYSMSEGLTEMVSREDLEDDGGPDWRLVGTARGLDPGHYVGEVGEKVGKYLAGSKNQQVPPRAAQADSPAINETIAGPG